MGTVAFALSVISGWFGGHLLPSFLDIHVEHTDTASKENAMFGQRTLVAPTLSPQAIRPAAPVAISAATG
tara:strand:+ start:59 stop:268 length:210 start_codon:yes stop_codon:yes gene_type:complete